MRSLRMPLLALLLALVAPGWQPLAAAQSAPTATLPAGTTYWRVTDYYGVDCAECGGYRVLRRTSATRARLAYVTRYDDGSKAVSCTRLTRTATGSWRDSYGTRWSYAGRKLKASDAGWWVIMSRASKAAVARALDSPSLQRAYAKCLRG